MLIQGLPNKGLVGTGDTGPQSSGPVKAVGCNGMTDRIGVNTEGLGDGADLPMLGKEPLPNLGASFCANHEMSTPPATPRMGKWIDETTPPTTDHTAKPSSRTMRMLSGSP